MYSKKVLELYENPKNVGTLDDANKNVGTAVVGAPACGDMIKLQIKVDENGVVVDSKFKAFGCGAAIASSALITEKIQGKSLDDIVKIRNAEIAEELALPPVKIHCSVLAEEAVKGAIEDYHKKQKQ